MEKFLELIVRELTNVADQQNLDNFFTEKRDNLGLYFQSNFIKWPQLNSRLFSPHVTWNQRDADIEGIERRTYAVEGWNYGIQAFFSGTSVENQRFFLEELTLYTTK